MKRIFWGSFLVLLLAACGTTKPDLPQATNTFSFSVDPAAQSVKLAAAPAGALTAQAEDGSRVLVPDTELSLESYNFTFLPGNMLAIDAVFKNVSDQTFTNLTFSRAASSNNVVSSTEPGVVATLKPGESTNTLRFTVQHRGQPFTYAVEARATVGETGGADCTDPVNIPDDILVESLRDALQKPEGDITCADLESLTELVVFGADITGDFLTYASNFEGLQFATNLTSLVIAGESFSEGVLNPIAGLTNLTELGLFSDGTQETDLSVLSNLTNLTEFRLSTNSGDSDYNGPLKLSDLSAFSSLTKLTELRFGDVAVSDISALSNLTNLERLEISNSQGDGTLADIEPLASLTKLEELRLTSNSVSDLSPLVANEALGDNNDLIDLSENCLDTSAGSQALADVDTIEKRNPNVQNVVVGLQQPATSCGRQPPPPPAEECTDPVNIPDDILKESLREALNKPEGDITCADLASLTKLVSRVEFFPEILPISNLEGIQFAKNLETLDFFVPCCEIADPFCCNIAPDYFRPLSGLTNLTTLKIFNSRDFKEDDYDDLDFSPLSGLSRLTVLSLPETQVSNIDFLSGLTNLSILDLSDNVIDDYSPLSNLTALKKLDLSADKLFFEFSGIEDIGFLSGLTALTDLDLSNNNVSDLSPLVANEALGDNNDLIDLSKNCLNTSPGSQALADVNTLESRNPDVQNVFAQNQREGEEAAKCG